jgi:hypothetical protein
MSNALAIYEDGKFELLRMASSINVVGGASKMFSYFIKNNWI